MEKSAQSARHVEGVILHETYTERGARIIIIWARLTERHEQDDYYRQNAP